ncbi:MAG: hypothetical protein EOM80_14740, partial [Erysipelotrichia bacterium]|nr:hypothetical protein [Erysipelotrichia bacterium]
MAKNDTGYTIFATAWGNSAIAWRDNAITKLVLPEKNGSNFELRCAELCSDYVESPATDRVDRAVKQIQKYFIGEKYDFKKIKLDLTDSSAFAQRVYHELQKIEPG